MHQIGPFLETSFSDRSINQTERVRLSQFGKMDKRALTDFKGSWYTQGGGGVRPTQVKYGMVFTSVCQLNLAPTQQMCTIVNLGQADRG